MNGTLIGAIIVAIIVISFYLNSRRLPAREMRPIIYGDADGFPSQHLYNPRWANALRKSGKAVGEETVVQRCRRDPLCAAVAFATEKQDVHRVGEAGSPHASNFWPYTLDPDTSTVYYHPTDAEDGPDLFVKKVYATTSKNTPADATPELIRPRQKE